MTVSTPKNEAEFLSAIITSLLSRGAKAEADARWLVGILPGDLLEFFRAEVLHELARKSGGSPVKQRKLFYSLSTTAKILFGPDYTSIKKRLNAESRVAVQKAENQ